MQFITTKVTYKQKEKLTDKLYLAKLHLDDEVDFTPGQFANILVADSTWRSYSILSLTVKELSFFLDFTPDGVGTRFFRDSKLPATTEITLPLGGFTLKESTFQSPEVIFIATGTGVAPIIPMIIKLNEIITMKSLSIKVKLYFGVRFDNEYVLDRLVSMDNLSNVELMPCITKGSGAIPNSRKNRVTEALDSDYTSLDGKDIYICGNPDMVTEVSTIAREKGCQNIYTERY